MLQQLYFYVPESHLESVKEAVFTAGAGEIGKYRNCAFETKGQGQFMPTKGSQPYVGEQNKLCQVAEYKVEIICHIEQKEQIKTALLKAHPYEEVAHGFITIN